MILVVLASRFETSKESLLGTLGLFGIAGIRLIPMASMFATTLTSLRFGRDAISRLYADVKNLGEPLNVIDKVLVTKESFTSLVLKNVQFS